MLQKVAAKHSWKVETKEWKRKKDKQACCRLHKRCAAYHKKNRVLFQNTFKTFLWERVNNNYQKFLASINNIIQQSLGETSTYSITTLSARLIREKKKSSEANIESAKHISDSFLKMMNESHSSLFSVPENIMLKSKEI